MNNLYLRSFILSLRSPDPYIYDALVSGIDPLRTKKEGKDFEKAFILGGHSFFSLIFLLYIPFPPIFFYQASQSAAQCQIRADLTIFGDDYDIDLEFFSWRVVLRVYKRLYFLFGWTPKKNLADFP